MMDLTKQRKNTQPFPSQNPIFHSEQAARAALEALRWPEGAVCPHCSTEKHNIKVGGTKHAHRAGLHHCKSCRKQFTVTVGTALARTRVSLLKWMRLAHLLSRTKKRSLKVSEVRAAVGVPYKTAVRMLDRVCDPLITYKGQVNKKRFGKPVTYFIAGKARLPQPRLRYPQDPRNPRDKANVGRRYARWKERLGLDHRATPEPRGVLYALAGRNERREDLNRMERLLMVLLQADFVEVKAARKLRRKWNWHRARLYEAERGVRSGRTVGKRGNELPEYNP
jgi:transposase-like protein